MALRLSDDDVLQRINELSDEAILRDLDRAQDDLSLKSILTREEEPRPTENEQLQEEVRLSQRELRGPSLGNLYTRLGLGLQSGVGELTKAAGGLIRGAPPTAGIVPVVDLVAPGLRKRIGTGLIEAGRARSEEARDLASHEQGPNIGGTAGDIVAPLAATATSTLPVIPAAMAGGLPAAALAAGAQSFGSTFADALDAYQKGEAPRIFKDQDADFNARIPAVASGLTTAIVTAGFGNTGIEAIRGGLARSTVTEALKNILKQAGMEAAEEAVDQIGQSIIQKLSYQPNKTLDQSIKEVLFAGAAGGLLGGATVATAETVKGTGGVIEDRLEDRRFSQASDRVAVQTAAKQADFTPEKRNLTSPELVAEETGWTLNPTPQIGGINLAGIPPAIVERLRKELPLQWEFTDRREDSPTFRFTTYVPVGSTPEQIKTAIANKAEEKKALDAKRAPELSGRFLPTVDPDGNKVDGQITQADGDGFTLQVGESTYRFGYPQGGGPADILELTTDQGNRGPTGPLATGQGAASLGVPLTRDLPTIQPASFAETVTAPGQRGRALVLEPTSAFQNTPAPGERGRTAPVGPKASPELAVPPGERGRELPRGPRGYRTGSQLYRRMSEDAQRRSEERRAVLLAKERPSPIQAAPISQPQPTQVKGFTAEDEAAARAELESLQESSPSVPATMNVGGRERPSFYEAWKYYSDQELDNPVKVGDRVSFVYKIQSINKAGKGYVKTDRNPVYGRVSEIDYDTGRVTVSVTDHASGGYRAGDQVLTSGPQLTKVIDKPKPGRISQRMARPQKSQKEQMDELMARIAAKEAALKGKGIVAGTQAEKWADDYIAKATQKANLGVDPVLAAAGAIKGLAILERGIRDFAAWSAEMSRQLGDWVAPHLKTLFERAQALESDAGQLESTKQLLRVNQAGALTVQVPAVQRVVSQIKAEIATRNQVGQKPVLTGAALDRRRAFDQVAAHPFIKKFFIEPVEKMLAEQAALDGAFTTYRDIKDNPDTDPVDKSGAAGVAVNQLDQFYSGLASFRKSYTSKRARLVDQVEAANEARAETFGEADVLKQLLEDFVFFGKETVSQARNVGAVQAFRKALGHSGGIENVLGFVAKNVSLPADANAAQIVEAIAAAAQPFITEDRGFEQVVGATRDVISETAEYLANSEPLRARLKLGKELLDNEVNMVPLSAFKRELATAIRAGDFNKAIQLFTKGVGATATERAATVKAAEFFKAAERRMLVNIAALDQVENYVTTLVNDPEWKALATEAYRDLGVREVIKGTGGTTITLEPVFDEEPTTLSLDPSKMVARENLDALKKYRDNALVYLSDPDAEGYDPRKAAALQAFLDDQDQLLNPAINPEAGKFIESWARRGYRTIFGFLGRLDLIPQFALDRTSGMASEMAHRTLNAYLTMQELKTSILRQNHQRLRDSLSKAMRSHQMEGDVDGYRDRVFAPLASSLQYFENTQQLRVGAPIGNGETVTKEDVEYFRNVRSFEKDVMDAAGGVGERAFESIRQNPGGILYKIDGKTYTRTPFETGPGTVNRRLGGRMARWANDWFNAKDSVEKISMINRNVDRLLFGYLSDVANPKFNFPYRYGQQLRSILAEAKSGNPVSSFDDLVQRILERTYEGESDEEASLTFDAIADQILHEIGQMFATYRRHNPTTNEKSPKSLVDIFGGDDSFNTARGNQIVPSIWYDYGSVGLAERLGYLHNSTVKFAIEHFNAVEALDRVLKDVVHRFEDRSEDAPGVRSKSRKEQQAGEDFYSWGEAERLSRDVTSYLNKLKSSLEYQVKVPEIGTELDPATQANAGVSFIVASLLTSASANVMNAFGGGLNIALFNQAVNNQNALASLLGGGVKAVERAFREAVNLLAHEGNPVGQAIYKVMQDASTKPLIKGMAQAAFNYMKATRELYGEARTDGLNLNIDLVNTVLSEWRWRESGGVEANTPEGAINAKVLKPLETMVRMATELLKQGTVGFVDSRLNASAVAMAKDIEHDLTQRAIRYGKLREQRANEGGWNPDDITDLRNRFSSKELVGGRLPDAAAMRMRDLLRRYADINVDALMTKFYRQWVDAGSPDTDSLPEGLALLSEAQRNQLALAISGDINQATFANRPIVTRSSKAGANLGLFLGYPAFEMYRLASLADRLSGKGFKRVENLPQVLGAALSLVVIGSLGVGLSEEARRFFLNRQSPFPTIFNFNQSPKSYALTLVNGAASMFPFYGAMVNAAIGRAYKTGYDLNSQMMLLNLGTDGYRLLKEFYQSGEYLRPIVRFAGRWTFPMNWIAPHLPIMKGLTEVSQVRNSLSNAARQNNMESVLKAPFSAQEVTYSRSTGPINDFMNAVGKQDMAGAMTAFQQLVDVKREEKSSDPVQAAIRAIESRNPVTQVFGAKPTSEEWNNLIAVMRPEDAQRVQSTLAFYDQAIQAAGARPALFVQQPPKARGTGGGGGVGGGGGGGSVPAAAAIAAPPAPRVSAGGSSIGPAATFRIRVPRIKGIRAGAGRIRSRVGRVRKVGGKLRSRLRIRRR